MKKSALWVTLAIIAALIVGGGTYALLLAPQSPKVVTTGSPSSEPSSASRNNNQTADSSGSSAGAANPQECQSKDFSATVQGTQGAAGSVYYTIELTNKGQNSCFTEGYPGVSLVNNTEQQIGTPAEKDASISPSRLTIAPQSSAFINVRVPQAENFPNGKCQSGASHLKIYLPDDTTSFTASSPITTWCPGFSVSVIQKNS